MRSAVMPRGQARWLMCLGVALLGVFGSWQLRWLCDDAFISFRYAEKLVAGDGLVFNAGERVEGITNLFWTLWIALGVALGAPAESWSIVWGVLAFGAACGGLAWMSLRGVADDAPLPIPWAGLAFALHRDALVFATSGLETAALCCALVFVLLLVSGPEAGRVPLRGRAALAGLLTALASGLRPDAILLAPLVALVPLAPRLPGLRALVPAPERSAGGGWDLRCSLAYGAGVLALWIPVNGARILYYGDFFPNTYYAKSADLTWWSQGVVFLGTYYARYGPYLLALPAAIGALAMREGRCRWVEIYLAIGFALLYTTYVVRVGGDFMYARLLIPTVPMLALALDAGLEGRGPWFRSLVGIGVIGIPWLIQPELYQTKVTDERAFYTAPARAQAWERRSEIMRHYFEGSDARVAFMGTWARAMRDADIDPAVEAATGLTDATIARQTLKARGLPGHEKRADPGYLADERRVHVVTGALSYGVLELGRVVPRVELYLPDPAGPTDPDRPGELLFVLRWDAALMAELRARGADLPDIRALVAAAAAQAVALPPEGCRAAHRQLARLYFDQVEDPELLTPLQRVCPLGSSAAP